MRFLIEEYEKSCELVRRRIKFLTEQRNSLIRAGKEETAESLNLEQRIRLLYVEHAQMREIVEHLKSYARRVEEHGKT